MSERPKFSTNGHSPQYENSAYKTPVVLQTEAPVIEKIKDLQDINYIWRDKVGVADEEPDSIFSRLQEEMTELADALTRPENKEELASELADIGLYVFAMMSSIGVQADKILSAKLNRNYHKYNPARVNELKSNGHDHDEAMGISRNVWDRSKDKEFFQEMH